MVGCAGWAGSGCAEEDEICFNASSNSLFNSAFDVASLSLESIVTGGRHLVTIGVRIAIRVFHVTIGSGCVIARNYHFIISGSGLVAKNGHITQLRLRSTVRCFCFLASIDVAEEDFLMSVFCMNRCLDQGCRSALGW